MSLQPAADTKIFVDHKNAV